MGRIDIYPFHNIGRRGERYPEWIRALESRNGVYLIREHGSDEIAYVGESHSDRLYGTLTRHFQRWSPKYDTAGPTYDRDAVEVAAVLVSKRHALGLQNELICVLGPRDNRLVCADPEGAAEGEEGAPASSGYDIAEIINAVFGTVHDDIPF